MEETYLLDHPGVKKKILHGGQGALPHFPPGTKLVFHFQTLKDDFERTVVDDSRRWKQPMEIFVGKMFKMEVWEVLLTSMRVGEVAEFWCDPIHTGLYPMVSKGMRLVAQGKDPLEGQRHMCGMGNMFNYSSMGCPVLDDLMREPQSLIFIMELISVGDPLSYNRESWMMDKDEKLQAVPSLHLQGNTLVKLGRYREAAAKYQEAVLLLRTVRSKEMPGDEYYIHLGRLIIPLVLNYCQCMLELEEYYEVLEHTTELLEKHKDCVKAYYKRAKANAAVWNEKEAKRDFHMVANLDPTLGSLVRKELQNLSEKMKEKYWEEKENYWKMMEEKEKKKSKKQEEGEVTGQDEGKEENDESEENREEEKEENQGTQKKKVDITVKKDVGKVVIHHAVEEREQVQVAAAEKEPTNHEAQGGSEVKEEADKKPPSLTQGKDWQQMLRLTMLLQKEGNFYMNDRKFAEAAEKFKEALEYVNFLQTKQVNYKEQDWESLEKVRVPLTLNLSQCHLVLKDYEQVVELTDRLLKRNRGNMRALYQRARAHSNLCHEEEAKKDLNKLQRLYPKFKPAIRREMRRLGENMRRKHVRENKNYWTTVKERYGSEGKGQAARRAGKKKGAGSVRVQKRKACKREIEQKVEEAQDDRDVAPNEEASGLDHRAGDRVKAPADADAGRDKAGNADKSGGDEIAEDAPLAGAAESSNNNTEGIKELSVMNVDCTINHESANKESKRTDTGSSNAGTKSSNKSPSGADGPHHCHVPVGEGTGRVGNTDEANAAKGAMPGSVGQRDAKVESPAGQSASGLEAVEPKTTPSAAQADKGSKTSKRRHKKKK
ncbi:uncharacterized protein LOC114768266 [Denticeps clupeoides]|uniref:AIP/AIPL N-terminal FKBP-type PPIase domain-containing protein n=1 Tax=Denticeps clupeoides TaxID=299321 RepID=A0AAY4EEK8_9TELE|nr:uncharacterized protein LOC114768266 [Denticeps clupeoides]